MLIDSYSMLCLKYGNNLKQFPINTNIFLWTEHQVITKSRIYNLEKLTAKEKLQIAN